MTSMPAKSAASETGLSKGIWLIIVLLMAAAFVLRGRYFGIPQIHVDEQFYLLVGDRMLHDGAIPYVDIWDRKPVGLFLLYAAIRLLGGNGIVEYQIVATLFAGTTAILVALWSSRFGGRIAGAIAGLFYLIFIHKFSGYGGEAEVFVNLFTTAAAVVTSRVVCKSGNASPEARLISLGIAAMLLSGFAIQIKPTAVFPGIFLGLTLMYSGYRLGWGFGRLVAMSLMWAAVALLPTALIIAWYALHGYLSDFIFANVYSVGLRRATAANVFLDRLRSQFLSVGLPIAGVLLAAFPQWRSNRHDGGWNREFTFILGWLISGTVAFLSVGTFYNNYALIVVPMICVLVGVVARPKGLGWLAIAGATAMSIYILIADQKRVREQRAIAPQIYGLADAISSELHGGCLYVHRGLPILYYLTHACLPTKFVFPDHLSLDSERSALGVDTGVEVRRIFASRPAVVVTHVLHRAPVNKDNEITSGIVEAELASGYHSFAPTRLSGASPFTAYRLLPGRQIINTAGQQQKPVIPE